MYEALNRLPSARAISIANELNAKTLHPKDRTQDKILRSCRERASVFKRVCRDKRNKLLGCSPNEYHAYLEALFKPGMTWENYGRGKGKWQIDHIKPCSDFDMTDTRQQSKCFHYTNTQPLWWWQNGCKGTL